jgi:exopolysaccharide biosynthesis polyprenyl glycosylphosphotransferase
MLLFFLSYIRRNGYNHRQIVILGDKGISERLIKSFSSHPEYGYDVAAKISDEKISSISHDMLFDQLLYLNPHEIFICYKQMDDILLKKLFIFADKYAVRVKLVTDLTLSKEVQVERYDNIPVLKVARYDDINLKVRILKRCFDVGFSLGVVTLGAPVFALIYVITKFSSHGPVFYKQERIGRNEKPFYIFKFRSMYVNAEMLGPQLSKDNDPRITKWGLVMRKTRLDELPQFWNVLKGEMSIVGPRPERQHYIEQIVERTPSYKKLFSLKPGITSMGQVHYGYAENVDQMCSRSKYDLLYLQNVNFNSDVDVILRTVRIMIQGKGK